MRVFHTDRDIHLNISISILRLVRFFFFVFDGVSSTAKGQWYQGALSDITGGLTNRYQYICVYIYIYIIRIRIVKEKSMERDRSIVRPAASTGSYRAVGSRVSRVAGSLSVAVVQEQYRMKSSVRFGPHPHWYREVRLFIFVA